MKRLLIALGMCLLPVAALAQSTAAPVVPGYLTTSGCTPSTATPCFVQFGAGGTGPGSNVAVVSPVGSQVSANGVSVTIASDQAAVAVKNVTASALNATVVQTPSAYTSSSALSANTVVTASAGKLTSFEVAADSTLSAAAWWIMIYDATSAPVDGAVTPKKCYAIPSGATGFTGAFNSPVSFSTGIVIGVSTTGCFTKTASTHAFISGDFQ